MDQSLPREIASGVWWLGDCLLTPYHGVMLHGYNSAYVVAGDVSAMIVETGHPQDLPIIDAQLETLVRGGLPPLRYAFCTHTETPHASGLGRLMGRFPELVVYSDLQDLPLVYPDVQDRMRMIDPGDELDLGGRRFVAVEAVIRDMPYTRWGFDTGQNVLFPGDGFAYTHYHAAGQCGRLAEETDGLDIPEMAALFADIALYWTRFVDMEPYVDRLECLLRELDVHVVAPTHGLPTADVAATFPEVRDGLLLGSRRGDQRTFI